MKEAIMDLTRGSPTFCNLQVTKEMRISGFHKKHKKMGKKLAFARFHHT